MSNITYIRRDGKSIEFTDYTQQVEDIPTMDDVIDALEEVRQLAASLERSLTALNYMALTQKKRAGQ